LAVSVLDPHGYRIDENALKSDLAGLPQPGCNIIAARPQRGGGAVNFDDFIRWSSSPAKKRWSEILEPMFWLVART
jgi:hypothetical protein